MIRTVADMQLERVRRLLTMRGEPLPLTAQETEMLCDLMAIEPYPDAYLADAVSVARYYASVSRGTDLSRNI